MYEVCILIKNLKTPIRWWKYDKSDCVSVYMQNCQSYIITQLAVSEWQLNRQSEDNEMQDTKPCWMSYSQNPQQLRTKASKASTSKQKLEHCYISVLLWFFRNEEVCEPASLREGSMQLWKGGANGNACGWSDYDKYLLRQSGTEGQRERQSAKVESFNYVWDRGTAFLMLLTLRLVGVYPHSIGFSLLLNIMCKKHSYLSLISQKTFKRGISLTLGNDTLCSLLLCFIWWKAQYNKKHSAQKQTELVQQSQVSHIQYMLSHYWFVCGCCQLFFVIAENLVFTPFNLRCRVTIVFFGPYPVLLCLLSHSVSERESKMTFSLKGRGASRHEVQGCESPNRNATLPRHLLKTYIGSQGNWQLRISSK